MQQIYRRTPIPKRNFNKVDFYQFKIWWDIILAWFEKYKFLFYVCWSKWKLFITHEFIFQNSRETCAFKKTTFRGNHEPKELRKAIYARYRNRNRFRKNLHTKSSENYTSRTLTSFLHWHHHCWTVLWL